MSINRSLSRTAILLNLAMPKTYSATPSDMRIATSRSLLHRFKGDNHARIFQMWPLTHDSYDVDYAVVAVEATDVIAHVLVHVPLQGW